MTTDPSPTAIRPRLARSILLTAALLLLTLAVGAAAAAGSFHQMDKGREQDRAKVEYVQGTLLDTPQGYNASRKSPTRMIATVQWTFRGEMVTDRIDVKDPYAQAGDTMRLLLDDQGNQVTRHRGPGAFLGQVMGVPNDYVWVPAATGSLVAFAVTMGLIGMITPGLFFVLTWQETAEAFRQRRTTSGTPGA